MKIVVIARSNSGVAEHRLRIPFSLMEGIDIEFTSNQDETIYNDCDMVVFNRTLPGESMLWLLRLQDKIGFKICIDIDDYWILGKEHILYEAEKEAKLGEFQERCLAHADVVFCTHERLAEEIKPFNENVHIIPNSITRKTAQFDIQTEPSDYVRLFWQGSRTHEKDLEILSHPVNSLKDIKNKIELMIAGAEEVSDGEVDPLWVKMIEAYCGVKYKGDRIIDSGLLSRHQYFLGLSASEYYGTYKFADICLAPLIRNQFNRQKSNLKILEAANMGLPVIASQVHPYLSMPVSYCLRSSDWSFHIRRMVDSKEAREDEGAKLKEFCDSNYNFDKINLERKQILEYEISRSKMVRG